MNIPFSAPALDPIGNVQSLRAKRYGADFRAATVSALYTELLNNLCDLDDVTSFSHPATLTGLSREAYRLVLALEDADYLGYDNGYQLLNDIREGLLGNIDARDHLVVSAFYRFGRFCLAMRGAS